MRFSVSPIVRVAVKAKNGDGVAKLASALAKLKRSDPCVECFVDGESKQHVVCGAGELHLEVCINTLRRLAKPVELVVSSAIVTRRESITSPSPVVLAKSANKHNRFFLTAQPLSAELIAELEADSLPKDGVEQLRHLVETHGWDRAHARKILAIGGTADECGANMLVDATQGVQYVHEVKEHLVGAFRRVCCEGGPLSQEKVRGVRFDIVDAKIHSDGAQRRAPQVVPAVVRGMKGAMLLAGCELWEPVYQVDIQVPRQLIGDVTRVLSSRRGVVSTLTEKMGEIYDLGGFLPVAESSGFAGELRGATHGKAFPSLLFDHWQAVPTDIQLEVVDAIRKRKGLPATVPHPDQFIDKM